MVLAAAFGLAALSVLVACAPHRAAAPVFADLCFCSWARAACTAVAAVFRALALMRPIGMLQLPLRSCLCFVHYAVIDSVMAVFCFRSWDQSLSRLSMPSTYRVVIVGMLRHGVLFRCGSALYNCLLYTSDAADE